MADLILVPTQREMDAIRPRMTSGLVSSGLRDHECAFQICGFGPIAAAARAGALLARYKPERVLLVGIAGSYVQRLSLGSACRFESVACDGVGVGAGINFQTAGDLGWYQFNGDEAEPRVGDVITLDSAYIDRVPSAGMLVTCCSASADPQETQWRQSRYPKAVAEDMEGFAVALACSLARVPLQIVRGISNRVGDREHSNWKLDEALIAAADFACGLMPETWMPSP